MVSAVMHLASDSTRVNFFNSEQRLAAAASSDEETRPASQSNPMRAPLAVNAPINATRSKIPMDMTGINFFESDDLIQEAKEDKVDNDIINDEINLPDHEL